MSTQHKKKWRLGTFLKNQGYVDYWQKEGLWPVFCDLKGHDHSQSSRVFLSMHLDSSFSSNPNENLSLVWLDNDQTSRLGQVLCQAQDPGWGRGVVGAQMAESLQKRGKVVWSLNVEATFPISSRFLFFFLTPYQLYACTVLEAESRGASICGQSCYLRTSILYKGSLYVKQKHFCFAFQLG